MLEINPEKLIKAIKARPALYNKSDGMYYSHRKHKERLWREICVEVHPSWESLKPVEKVECVRDMQKRWKSLRTCFTRELAIQRKERFKEENSIPVKKRKKYSYFDSMSFLLGDNPEQFELRESEDSSDPLDARYEGDIEYSFNDGHTETMNITNIVPESYEMPVYEKNEEFETKVLNTIKGMKKSDDDDDDKQFMMSLVPMFRKLTDKQKIEARIEMLKVVQRISFE
ncbi:uncharacterized protein LOC119839876 [Zerene cesonia]|uniref:uncharacterized protein LOC119839876 n=1 Tax=Zerene cesonia TaxID=33412 RepID=UPI0018E54551|nr:uncharacterized protein LOC119839876 [Zerene cesonia]